MRARNFKDKYISMTWNETKLQRMCALCKNFVAFTMDRISYRCKMSLRLSEKRIHSIFSSVSNSSILFS